MTRQKQAKYSRCMEGREWVGLGRPGREAYMQVYTYKFVVWLFWKFVSKIIFIHADLHLGYPAWVAQADFRLSPIRPKSEVWYDFKIGQKPYELAFVQMICQSNQSIFLQLEFTNCPIFSTYGYYICGLCTYSISIMGWKATRRGPRGSRSQYFSK